MSGGKKKKENGRQKKTKKKTNQKNLLNEEDESSPAPHDENRRPISTLFFFLSSSFLFCFFFGFFFIVEPSVGVDFEEKKKFLSDRATSFGRVSFSFRHLFDFSSLEISWKLLLKRHLKRKIVSFDFPHLD